MRCLVIFLVIASVLGCACVYAADTVTDREVRIFKGDDPSADGIEMGAWGSGSAAKSKEFILDGSWGIRFITQGLYAGGRIDFTRPVTLFTGTPPADRYIQFAFFFKDTKTVNPAAGSYSADDIPAYKVPVASKIRFMFYGETGDPIAIEKPTCKLDSEDNWMRIAVPLSKLKTSEDAAEFKLKRLVVTTDRSTTLHLGEIKLVSDNTPIKVETLEAQSVIITDEVFWAPEINGGLAMLKYSWDYDASDGLQAESTDMVGRYVYTKASKSSGDGTIIPYIVTLTVSDADGIKAPVTITTKIEVGD